MPPSWMSELDVRGAARGGQAVAHDRALQPCQHTTGELPTARRRSPYASAILSEPRALAAAPSLGTSLAAQAQTVKLALIDPQSGLMAPVGLNQLHSWQYIADIANQQELGRRAEVRDRRASTTSSAAGIAQRSSSARSTRASATSCRATARRSRCALHRRGAEAQRAQSRQGDPVPQLRGGRPGIDQRASARFWHFRFDANSRHEDGGADHLHGEATRRSRSVYLLNQDYSFGQAVAKAASEMLAAQAPRHQDRRRRRCIRSRRSATSRPTSPKIKAAGRRHGDHRQLGQRHGAADQGRQGRRPATSTATPTTAAAPALPTAMGEAGDRSREAVSAYWQRQRTPKLDATRGRGFQQEAIKARATTTRTGAHTTMRTCWPRRRKKAQVERSGEGRRARWKA